MALVGNLGRFNKACLRSSALSPSGMGILDSLCSLLLFPQTQRSPQTQGCHDCEGRSLQFVDSVIRLFGPHTKPYILTLTLLVIKVIIWPPFDSFVLFLI